MNTDPRAETVNVETAAKILGIGRQTAYDLAGRGELPGAVRLGGRIVVSKRALDAFLDDPPISTSPAIAARRDRGPHGAYLAELKKHP